MPSVLRTLCLVGLLVGSSAAQTVLPPDETKTLGKPVPDARLFDDRGNSLQLSALAGKPLVLSPIFTKCPHTCGPITLSLRDALEEVGVAGEDFNVVSLSFDVSDTEADLKRFHESMELPDAWRVVSATNEELFPILEAIDFRFISVAEANFTHPNVVVLLSPELEVAKYLYGVEYTAGEVRAGLKVAGGGSTVLDHLGPYVLLIGVIGVLVTSFLIVSTVWKVKHRHVG